MSQPTFYELERQRSAAMPPPRCPQCNERRRWVPAQCECGHPYHAHHYATQSGNLLYCSTAETGGPCPCRRYQHTSDGKWDGS